MTIKMFSMFSGIGGFELAAKSIDKDIELIGYSEIDKYAIEVFNRHFPGVKNYGDATKINARELPKFDLLVAGFPCQAFSVAGRRRGFDDTRGTLFFDIARILKNKRPRHLVLENVKGLLSHDKGKTFQTILRILSDLGYGVEWQVLNSKNHGVPQHRERIFIIGHLGRSGGRKIFPFAKSSEVPDVRTTKVASTLQHPGHSGGNYRGMNLIQTGVIGKDSEATRVYDPEGISRTIKNGGGIGAKTGLYTIAPLTERRTEEAKKIRRKSMQEGRDYSPRRMKELVERKDGLANTVTSAQSKEQLLKVKESEPTRIRRLTPTECERLQGFPDGWTQGLSDTQRYKTLGNAVTVNVVTAILKSLYREKKEIEDHDKWITWNLKL